MKRTSRQASVRNKDSRNFILEQQSKGTHNFVQSSRAGMYSPTQAENLLTSTRKESKLRIAKPPRSIIAVSTGHWNQISAQLQKNLDKRPGKLIRKESQKENTTGGHFESYTEKFGKFRICLFYLNFLRLKTDKIFASSYNLTNYRPTNKGHSSQPSL